MAAEQKSDSLSYKDLKQAFVSNLTGTTVFETVEVLCCVVLFHLFGAWIRIALHNHASPRAEKHHSGSWFSFAVDFLSLIPGAVLVVTYLSNNCHVMFFFSVFCIVASFSASIAHLVASEKHESLISLPLTGHRPFISHFRAFVNVLTAICILAVDFRVYPRRFAKTEIYGIGLMDAGVGFYVFSNGIVAPQARGKPSTEPLWRQIFRSVKGSLPLWILGFARLAAIKSTDYQEHVSEYGVHWNFFFTLALVKVAATAVSAGFPKTSPGLLGCSLVLTYEVLLSTTGLKQYIINGPSNRPGRGNLVDANREGLWSTAGYVALYFVAVECGKFLFRKRTTFWDWFTCFLQLAGLILASALVLWLCRVYVDEISRRLANLAYVLYIVLTCGVVLASLLAIDLTFTILCLAWSQSDADKKSKNVDYDLITSRLLVSINKHGLVFFLLANLLTGFVNITINTLAVGTWTAVGIMMLYMFCNCLVMHILTLYRIRTKFW